MAKDPFKRMGVSYAAIFEMNTHLGKDDVKKFTEFFTDKTVDEGADSDIAHQQANDWLSEQLRTHGTQNVRATVCKVLWSIIG